MGGGETGVMSEKETKDTRHSDTACTTTTTTTARARPHPLIPPLYSLLRLDTLLQKLLGYLFSYHGVWVCVLSPDFILT